MANSDRPNNDEIEISLESLLADCDEAMARGEDPTVLLNRLRDFPPEARHQFSEIFESLRSVKEILSPRHSTFHFPRPFGKFRLLQVLGQGGFGLVFLAEDLALGRKVALKVPRLHQLVAPGSLERFSREARAAAALEHPHLVPIFEIGQAEGLPFLASAYCDGPSLAEWLKTRDRPVPFRAAAELVKTLAQAAAHMHDQGIVHRDLKPSNVLLFPRSPSSVEHNGGSAIHANAVSSGVRKPLDDLTAKITDFGLARQGESFSELTRTGMVAGTAAYMAPEQAWGSSKSIGPAADIYALGVILYEMLTGRPPFDNENNLETLRRAEAEDPIPTRKLRPETPRDLETICLRCLEKRPESRYASMIDLADDLQRFLERKPIKAKPAGWVDRTNKWVRRQPIVAALTGLAAVLLFALISGSIWFGWREHRHGKELEDALEVSQKKRILAEENEWLMRNRLYAAQMRECANLKEANQMSTLREILLAQQPKPDEKDLRGFEWNYLWQYARESMVPGSPVGRVSFSREGMTVAAGYHDKTIKVFETVTGKRLATLRGQKAHFSSIHFLNDRTQLISTGHEKTKDGVIKEYIQWDTSKSEPIIRQKSFVYKSKYGPLLAVAAASRVLFIVDRDKTHHLITVNLGTGEEKRVAEFDEHVETMAASATGDRIALVIGNFLEWWDPASAQCLGKVRVADVHEITMSPDGKSLALLAGWKKPFLIEIRDLPDLKERSVMKFDEIPAHIAFDRDGKHLAVITPSNQSYLFDAATGEIREERPDTFISGGVAFSPNENKLAIGESDGRVRMEVGFFEKGEQTLPGPAPKSEAWCLAFSKDGKQLAVGYDHSFEGKTKTLRLWDVKTRKPMTLIGHASTVMALNISPNGHSLATASYDRKVRLWELTSGKSKGILEGHSAPVRAVAFSPDSQQIASGGTDQSIKLWNAQDQTLINSWKAHDDMIRAILFSPDGRHLVSAANDCEIKFWDVKDQSLIRAIGDNNKVQGLAFSPDGTLLASAHENNKVHFWDPVKGIHLKALLGHAEKVRCVAFSPDGRTLASGGEDKTVRLWNVISGQELMALPVDHFVNNLAFDPTGQRLAAALHNGKVKIWTAE